MTDRVILPDFCFNNQRFLTEPNSESLVIHARVDAFAAGGDLGGGGCAHPGIGEGFLSSSSDSRGAVQP